MALYKCYFFNEGGHIVNLAEIACASDPEARQVSIVMLNKRPKFHGVAVWQGERKVFAEFIPPVGTAIGWPRAIEAA